MQIADYAPAATFGQRTLPNFELVWLLRGSAELRTDLIAPDGTRLETQTHLLRPGTLALTRKGNQDSYRWDPERPSRHAYVHVDVLDHGPLGDPDDWPTVRTMTDLPVLAGLCDYLLALAGQSSVASKARSDQLVELVLDLFVRGPATLDEELPPPVARVCDHVGEVWRAQGLCLLTVAELAQAAHVSTGYLHRVFKERHGCGPARALELVRLARAATALVRSNDTIAEVSTQCGFSNPYHFSRRFRLTYGQPPGGFRQSQQLVDPFWPVRDAQLQPLAQRVLGLEPSAQRRQDD